MRRQSRRFVAEWLGLGVMLLVIATVLAGALYRDRGTVEAREADRLRTLARVIDENLMLQLAGANKALLGIGAELRGADLSRPAPSLLTKLELLTDAQPGVSSMLVMDSTGTVVAASLGELTGKNFRQREYFAAPRRAADPTMLHVSPPFHTTLGNDVVVISRALADEQGAFSGVITATLDSNYFTGLLRSVLYAPDMRTTLIHRDGKVFLSTSAGPEAEGPDVAANGAALDRHLRSASVASLTTAADGPSGDERLVAMRTIERADLHIDKTMIVAVSRSLADVYSPWWERVRQLLLLLAILTIGSSTALHLHHRRRRTWGEASEAIERERQLAAARVRDREEELRLVTDNMPALVSRIDTEQRFCFANRAYGDWLQLDPASILGKSLAEVYGDEAYATFRVHIERALAGERVVYEREMRTPGAAKWVEVTLVPQIDHDGTVKSVCALINDITARHDTELRLAMSEERLTLALECSGLALFDWNIAAGTMFHSAQAAMMRGDLPQEFTAPIAEMQAFVHPADMPTVLAQMKATLTGAAPVYLSEYRLRRGVDDWLWVRAHGRVVQRDAAGRALRLAGTYTDINDAKIAEGRLRRLAEFDTLTGLPNRALFNDRLQQGMARAARGKPMALLFLDIDRFKSINDSFGHEAGDKLLKVFASRMLGAVRQSDTVARLAGDEFTIILEQLGSAGDAEAIARKLVESLRQPVAIAGRMLEVTVSIGVALCAPGDGNDVALLRRADEALYEAKRRGRDGFHCDDVEPTFETQAAAGSSAVH